MMGGGVVNLHRLNEGRIGWEKGEGGVSGFSEKGVGKIRIGKSAWQRSKCPQKRKERPGSKAGGGKGVFGVWRNKPKKKETKMRRKSRNER